MAFSCRKDELKAKLEKAKEALKEIESSGYYRSCDCCDGGENLWDTAVKALKELEGG